MSSKLEVKFSDLPAHVEVIKHQKISDGVATSLIRYALHSVMQDFQTFCLSGQPFLVSVIFDHMRDTLCIRLDLHQEPLVTCLEVKQIRERQRDPQCNEATCEFMVKAKFPIEIVVMICVKTKDINMPLAFTPPGRQDMVFCADMDFVMFPSSSFHLLNPCVREKSTLT